MILATWEEGYMHQDGSGEGWSTIECREVVDEEGLHNLRFRDGLKLYKAEELTKEEALVLLK